MQRWRRSKRPRAGHLPGTGQHAAYPPLQRMQRHLLSSAPRLPIRTPADPAFGGGATRARGGASTTAG
nr:unnamed protein product [Callosobruchus chinensis]